MKQFWDYMEMVEGGNKISERMKSFVRKLIRIANNDEEKKMFENEFKITFKSIPELSKVITPQDVEWAKNIQKQLKKFNKEDLYDWFEDLPEAMYMEMVESGSTGEQLFKLLGKSDNKSVYNFLYNKVKDAGNQKEKISALKAIIQSYVKYMNANGGHDKFKNMSKLIPPQTLKTLENNLGIRSEDNIDRLYGSDASLAISVENI